MSSWLYQRRLVLEKDRCGRLRGKTLYWVDLNVGHLHAYIPATGEQRVIHFNQPIGCVVPRQSGGLMMAMADGFYAWHEEAELSYLAAPADMEHKRFNDGKCDPAGRFWAGTVDLTGAKHTGILYCLHEDHSIIDKVGNVSMSNGMGWSPDHTTMYYIDSAARNVMAYDYDIMSGEITNGRIAVAFSEEDGLPDGMTVDVEGMIWVAHWGPAKVTRWNPDKGELLEVISVPALFVTSCTFGGPEGNELYMTTAREGMSIEELERYPDAGGLFRIRTQTRGLPAYAFKG